MDKIKSKGKKILGFYLLVIGILLFLKIIFYESFRLKYGLSAFGIVSGSELIIRSFRRNKKDIKLFFPGLILLSISCFVIVYYGILIKFNITLIRIWPVLGFFPGIGLILYYLVYSKKSASIIIPGIFITMFSAVLLFGSLGVVHFNFTTLLVMSIPSILIIIGLYFIFSRQIDEIKDQFDFFDKKDDDSDNNT